MWPESSEIKAPLRTGLTTGTCATACSLASAKRLLTHQAGATVKVTLPKGKVVELAIISCEKLNERTAVAATIKDAGDDPDVTHGAEVFVKVELIPEKLIKFVADKGVGTVTREGLALAVGEPAINPVPRQMIKTHLQQVAAACQYEGGFIVSVGVKKGEVLAQKTMNPRLGIVGGLSILGTTGIVRPFSCAAYIASIHQGIDVAHANGIAHIAASTGSSSEKAIVEKFKLDDMALIEMGDFVGAVIKYLKKPWVARLSICAGFGKMTKLSQGQMNLNSNHCQIDFTYLTEIAKQQGADLALQTAVKQANTSIEALNISNAENIDLVTPVCMAAYRFIKAKIHPSIAVDVWAINRQGQIIGGYAGERHD